MRELQKLLKNVWDRQFAIGETRGQSLATLASLIGAEAGIFVEDTHFVPGGMGPLASVTGLHVDGLMPAVSAVIGNRSVSPIFNALARSAPPTGGTLALSTGNCMSRRDWNASPLVDEFFRPLGLADNLASIKTLGERGHVFGINLIRAKSDRFFSEEDRALLELFTDAAADHLRIDAPAVRWRLTATETKILEELRLGRTNKEMAVRFECSTRTVEAHVASVLRKAGASSRSQLVAMLMQSAPR